MEKEFVPYELAFKLKELGFNEPCFGWFTDSQHLYIDNIRNGKMFKSNNGCLAPTFSQAFRWFREKYGMYSHIKTSGKISVLEFTWVSNGKYGFFSKNGFETYEEAELACLEKLIEIVELKTE